MFKLILLPTLFLMSMESFSMGSKRMKVPAPTKQLAEYVVILGIDGLGGHNLKKGDLYKHLPNLMALRANSAWTEKAAIDLFSLSGPNWAAMQTGSRSSKHKVFNNECQRGKGLPTIFDQIKKYKPELTTATVANWDKIACYSKEGSIDTKIKTQSDEATTEKTIELIKKEAPNFLFVHFDDVDHYGHSSGKGNTPEYNTAVIKTDKRIGKVVKALKEKGIFKDTLIIVVADHGHGLYAGGHSSGLHPVPLYLHHKNFIKGEMKRRVIPSKQLRVNLVAPVSAYFLGIPDAKEWQYSSKALLPYILN
ncbi:MAG: alkaline phosphatase family protein [Bacteriovoracaceae bacterium]